MVDGCEECDCDAESSAWEWTCDSIPCEPCTPGETRRPAANDCNVCTCDGNGPWSWTCTQEICTGPVPCGDGIAAPCTDDEFCNYVWSTTACGGEGICTATPQYCQLDEIPMCGCDGVTYHNSCYANVLGVSIALWGLPCPSTP